MIFIEIQNWTLKEIFPQITKIELDLHVLYKDIFLAEMRKQNKRSLSKSNLFESIP